MTEGIFWSCTWRFLHFDHLTVGELRAVVDDGERVARIASGAQGRLQDAATVDFDGGRVAANVATEERLTHFRDDIRRANDHTADGDQLIDI